MSKYNDNKLSKYKLSNKERRQLQHQIKVYIDKYFKERIGKGADYTKVIIWDDMLIIRGEKFLTEPEKYIINKSGESGAITAARIQVAVLHAVDNLPYFEEILGAKCIHQTYDVETENDYWIHVMVFDQVLIEQ